MLRRAPWTGWFLFACGVMVLGSDRIGGAYAAPGITLSAAVTVFSFIAASSAVLAVKLRSGRIDRPRGLLVLGAFEAWAVATSVWHGLSMHGAQNLITYALFMAGITLGLCATALDEHRLFMWTYRIAWVRALTDLLVLLVFISSSPTTVNKGAMALQELLLLAVVVSQRPSRWQRAVAAVLVVDIFLTESRTPLVAAVVAVVLAYATADGRLAVRRLILTSLALVLAAGASVMMVPSLHARYFVGDRARVAGVTINTSGRTDLWRTVARDAQKSPWVGLGAGSATDLLRPMYPHGGDPHNDYLRIWHDTGAIGAFLWLTGYCLLAAQVLRLNRATGWAPIHRTAFTLLVIVALLAITGNILTYYFAMLPVGLVTGMSFAAARSSRVGRSGATGSIEAGDAVEHSRSVPVAGRLMATFARARDLRAHT